MIEKLIFFFVSLSVSCITCYIASILRASGIKDRSIKSLETLCFTLPFWLILTAVKMIIKTEFLPAAVVIQQISINITTYMTLWFLLQLIESKLIDYKAVRYLLAGIPALDIFLLLTNPWHMLYFTSYHPIPGRYFLQEGAVFYIHLAVMIFAILIVYSLLLKYIITNFKNRPVLILSGIGAVIPLVLNLIYIYADFEYDFTAMGYLPTVLLFSYTFYAPRLQRERAGILSSTLAKIARSQAVSLGEVQEAARLISYEGCLALDAYRVGIWSYEENTHAFKSVICFNSVTNQHSIQDEFVFQNHPEYKELLLSERIITISNTKAPNVLSPGLNNYDSNICSLMQAPIRIGDRLVGIISIVQNSNRIYPEKREWNPEEQSFALSLADQLAIAIANKERHILKEAESASKAKSQFITNISHEIRTPMNAVLGMVEIALRENDLETKNEHLQTVKQAGIHLMSIINDILDFSKIESGRQDVVQEEYSVESLLNEIVGITSMGTAGSQIRFAVKADNNIPRMLYGDEVKIRQIVLNLLDNAIKYTERGSVSLGVYGEIVNSDTMNLIIAVSDTGIGIKPENIDLLLSDSSELDDESSQGIEGAGLGFAITKKYVDAMEGNIDVYSEYGKGSIFTVSIPQKYHSHEPMAVVKKPEGKSVLIFERRDIYAETLAFTVKNLGVYCKIVSSGTELFEEMENKKFDYLFMSFGLYKKNEDTVAKFGQETEIIILTEFDEVINEKNLKTLTMPVYCTVIAEVLDGIFKSIMYSAGNESAVNFSAPEAKVLVVDDIKTNLKVAQGLLAPYNLHIDLCTNGKAAIQAVHSEQYDLVFMDHRMPGIDGVEAVRRIRLWEKDQMAANSGITPVPIVALTANAVLGIREMFLKNGFNDYLPKPIDTALLNEILEKWIPKEKQVKK